MKLAAGCRYRYDAAAASGGLTVPGSPVLVRECDFLAMCHSQRQAEEGSNQALKGPKRHQAVTGYWHMLTTSAGYCRVRSYLVSVRAVDAIHAALTDNPWLPIVSTARSQLKP